MVVMESYCGAISPACRAKTTLEAYKGYNLESIERQPQEGADNSMTGLYSSEYNCSACPQIRRCHAYDADEHDCRDSCELYRPFWEVVHGSTGGCFIPEQSVEVFRENETDDSITTCITRIAVSESITPVNETATYPA